MDIAEDYELKMKLTIEQATEDYFMMYGYELTMLEMIRQIKRFHEKHACEVTESSEAIIREFVFNDRRLNKDRRRLITAE